MTDHSTNQTHSDMPRQNPETAPHPTLLAIIGVGGLAFAGYIFHITNPTKESIDDKVADNKPVSAVVQPIKTPMPNELFTYDSNTGEGVFEYISPRYNMPIKIIFAANKQRTGEEAFNHLNMLSTFIRDQSGVSVGPDDYFALIRTAQNYTTDSNESDPRYRGKALVVNFEQIEKIREQFAIAASKNQTHQWLQSRLPAKSNNTTPQ